MAKIMHFSFLKINHGAGTSVNFSDAEGAIDVCEDAQ